MLKGFDASKTRIKIAPKSELANLLFLTQKSTSFLPNSFLICPWYFL